MPGWPNVIAQGHPRGSLHPAALAATAGPIEREHLHAVARGFGHGCAEEGATVHADRAQHPDRRAADDLAGGVEAIDLKAHALGGPHGLVVDIALDRRPLPAARHLPLDAEIAFEAHGGIDLSRETGIVCEA